jgi:uncharacterized membrane protein YqaE (UPF0057 family)
MVAGILMQPWPDFFISILNNHPTILFMKRIFTRLALMAMLFSLSVPSVNAVTLPGNPASTEPDPATVKAALAEFSNLSKKEKKARFKEVKKAIKEYKAKKKAEPVTGTFLQVLFAILIPPLGVYLHEGEINKRFWIDLLLTLLFFLPGMIYALVRVLGE